MSNKNEVDCQKARRYRFLASSLIDDLARDVLITRSQKLEATCSCPACLQSRVQSYGHSLFDQRERVLEGPP